MRFTQQDIARIAKVSQPTVSRVVAGDMKVEPAIRRRVEDVMMQNNYKADVRARSLRSRKTHLIGLVINRPAGTVNEDPFFSSLISGITDFLRDTPYHLCVDAVGDGEGQAAIYDELLRSRRVDGLILVESEATDHRIERLQRDHFPFVLIGNPLSCDEIHSVDNDNVHAGELATKHLLDEGFKRVGILGARMGVTFSDDRITGYQRAVRGRQEEHLIWHSEFGLEASKETTKKILQNPRRSEVPDALVVIDDFMAMGSIFAVQELGLKVPNDLGIISFNDTSMCALIQGGLSSVSLQTSDLVHTACRKLLRIIDEDLEDAPRTIIPTELKIRGSSVKELNRK